ncbi:MAG: radical SAM protein [Candidatus Bathyarchaeota archaeon]|nr:radical SAM protein [Candidatus Bathyarchaeota archaeon]
MSGEEVDSLIRSGYFANSYRKIRFYAPSFMYYKTGYFHSAPAAFPSISITGRFCALKCKHCYGKVLNTMLPAVNPEQLVNLCKQLKRKGAIGCLISGGCLPDGSVPLGRFLGAIAKVKKDLGLTVVVHTGVIELSMAEKLREAGVDAALIDVIGSDETIKEIYQLNMKVQDFDTSLKALQESGIPYVPHVLVGLHYGKLKGEFKALQMISKYRPSAVIIIALMPIHGTPMKDASPPTATDIAKVLAMTRLMMPGTPLVLGCMRPKGETREEIDVLAVKAGANAIAFPAEKAINMAESLGLEITFSSLCCSQIYEDTWRNP